MQCKILSNWVFTEFDIISVLNIGFHRASATSGTWRQGTLTSLDTLSRLIMDLHMFYWLRTIFFPNLSIVFSGLCTFKILRYFLLILLLIHIYAKKQTMESSNDIQKTKNHLMCWSQYIDIVWRIFKSLISPALIVKCWLYWGFTLFQPYRHLEAGDNQSLKS